jgi:hypothetical protein
MDHLDEITVEELQDASRQCGEKEVDTMALSSDCVQERCHSN